MYADDTSLFSSSEDLDELYSKANSYLVKYKEWFDSNKLTLNAKKSQLIIFHRKQRKLRTTENNITIGSEVVEKVDYTKFLGLLIDKNLSWDRHILNLSRKLSKYVPIIYRIRKICNLKSLKLLYNCLIYSNLIYCNSVWGHCKSVALNPLLITHKKIIRALAGVGSLHPTEELFRELSLLNLRSINEYMVGIFIYKATQNDEYSTWFLTRNSERVTRSAEQEHLLVPSIRNEHSRQCILYRGPVIWNNINLEIRKKSYDHFKINYKIGVIASQ